ncbi:hypothetical protein Nepgr_024732 [Nepenthes gracilis]|uniref:Uncharacterized protein n=1 Tax=Nepenthes gracilis TaxID=150966 RepID=A0AAD3Y0B6_NEPGR|nr:hypothetical protein Nepgr_024732 [Nepenthes gracilis]
MPSQLTDSDPIQTSSTACSASAGDVPEEDGALSGSMKDKPAIVVTNADHSVLDVGAPFVADHAADSPHRPLISTGVDGDAISDELGLNPGVDGSTQESIARIARKYSLVDVVDGLLNKAPFEFHEVRPIPLSGCPVKGSEASVAEAEMICDSGRGLELALPNVDPYAVLELVLFEWSRVFLFLHSIPGWRLDNIPAAAAISELEWQCLFAVFPSCGSRRLGRAVLGTCLPAEQFSSAGGCAFRPCACRAPFLKLNLMLILSFEELVGFLLHPAVDCVNVDVQPSMLPMLDWLFLYLVSGCCALAWACERLAGLAADSFSDSVTHPSANFIHQDQHSSTAAQSGTRPQLMWGTTDSAKPQNPVDQR